jgi:protein-disulfide isomerase
MPIRRRSLLSVVAAAPLVPLLARPAAAQESTLTTERSLGQAGAKVVVNEWFSLTCTHCAAFAREIYPQIKSELIATGKVRLVFRDFPLDRLALTAAQVARYLPPAQYDPFIEALFASQDRWAFRRGINNTDEIFKLAALAGMSRPTFDTAVADEKLANFILAGQQEAQDKYHVDSTPSFVINGKNTPGEMSYEQFAKMVADAAS